MLETPQELYAEANRLESEARSLRAKAAGAERAAEAERMCRNAEIPVDREAVTLTDGSPVTPDHREIGKDGMQKGYVVLSDEERAKGFVRPVRRSYVHVGADPICGKLMRPNPLPVEDLRKGWVANLCSMPRGHEGECGFSCQLVTEIELRHFNRDGRLYGCGGPTTMGLALAETYARDPEFYSGTFCAHCRQHFPVGEFGEFVWQGTEEKVGT